jgi:hypothetical protein
MIRLKDLDEIRNVNARPEDNKQGGSTARVGAASFGSWCVVQLAESKRKGHAGEASERKKVGKSDRI